MRASQRHRECISSSVITSEAGIREGRTMAVSRQRRLIRASQPDRECASNALSREVCRHEKDAHQERSNRHDEHRRRSQILCGTNHRVLLARDDITHALDR